MLYRTVGMDSESSFAGLVNCWFPLNLEVQKLKFKFRLCIHMCIVWNILDYHSSPLFFPFRLYPHHVLSFFFILLQPSHTSLSPFPLTIFCSSSCLSPSISFLVSFSPTLSFSHQTILKPIYGSRRVFSIYTENDKGKHRQCCTFLELRFLWTIYIVYICTYSFNFILSCFSKVKFPIFCSASK